MMENDIANQRIEALESWRAELLARLDRRDEKQDRMIEQIFSKLDSISESIQPIRDWMNLTKGWKSGVIWIGMGVSALAAWIITTLVAIFRGSK